MFPTGAGQAKRRKIERYPKGSVIRVEVKNFMTYAHAVIEPGPRLNLVLGPNGTGKSSLVCALCVGLGGSTRLLGRAEHVSQFVRRGTPSGEVSVTLSSGDPARPHVVRRRIKRDDNSSVWTLNGREVNMKDVLELVHSLNIQLDNLCQFLPQDKVVEFARLRPEELLRATEEAVGDSQLKELHEELVQLRANAAHQAASEAQIAAALETLKGDHARAERNVAQIREKEKLEAEAEALRQKVPWAEYDEAKKEFEGEKGRLAASQAALRTMRERQAAGDAPVKAKRKEAEKAATAEKRAKEAMQRADWTRPAGRGSTSRAADRRTALEDLVAKIEGKQTDLENLQKKSDTRKRKIEAAKKAIVEGEKALEAAEAAAAPDPAAERRMKDIELQKKDLTTQENAIASEIDDFRGQEEEARRVAEERQQRLSALSDARLQRLRELDNRFRGIYVAHEWIRANRTRFRGPVYGPVGVEIECPDAAHAAMLENQISAVWMSQFVVIHREDQDLLKKEVPRACNGFIPHVAWYSGDPDAPANYELGHASEFAKFGVVNTLDEVFQAPAAVKKALDNNFFLSKVFCCRRDADTAGFFKEQPRAEIVFTPDSKISHRVSRYNAAAVSTVTAALRPARILRIGGAAAGGGNDRAPLQEALNAARAAEAAAKAARQAKEPELAEVRRRKRELTDEGQRMRAEQAAALRRKTDLKARLTSKRTELQRLENAPEPLDGRPALEAEIDSLLSAAADGAVGLADAFVGWASAAAAVSAPSLAARELGDQAERLAAAARDSAVEAERMEGLVKQYESEVRELKKKMDAKHAAAKEATGWPIPEELAAAFASMPATVAELRAAAAAKADEAEGVCVNDPNALARHQQRAAEIAENERQLQAAVAARETAANEIAEKKERWVGDLRRICATVNANFSEAFPSVGVAGEVGLREAPDDDFANYAIEIRVKFREAEALATLDASRQSGGERSVSTILYLVALQEVAAAPFRVVDEINQGMDPVNERKVFRLLVDAATAPDTPQCFLLTPKLLPDLPFSREVTVLQIMNGTTIREVAQGFKKERIAGDRGAALVAANA